MAVQRKFTIPQMLDLADRLIAAGTNNDLKDSPQLNADCLSAGLILANLLLKSVIAEAVILGGVEDNSAPPK